MDSTSVATLAPGSPVTTPPFRRADVGGVALTQALEGAVAQLSHPLARNAELARDLLQRHRPVALEAEVQRQHTPIARLQHLERTGDRLAT